MKNIFLIQTTTDEDVSSRVPEEWEIVGYKDIKTEALREFKDTMTEEEVAKMLDKYLMTKDELFAQIDAIEDNKTILIISNQCTVNKDAIESLLSSDAYNVIICTSIFNINLKNTVYEDKEQAIMKGVLGKVFSVPDTATKVMQATSISEAIESIKNYDASQAEASLQDFMTELFTANGIPVVGQQ